MLRQFEQHLLEGDWRQVQAGVEVKLVPGPDGTETFILTRSADRRAKEQAMQLSQGCYLLRTNLTDADPALLWKRYIQLTEAESAFRITKDELVILPIWHHLAWRVEGQILVCFLAYVSWKTLAQWMRRSVLGRPHAR
jgi:hypothetical protein